MFEWKQSYDKPQDGSFVICYCPEGNGEGYIVAKYSRSKGFYYEDQPNGMFNDLVVAWSYFPEY